MTLNDESALIKKQTNIKNVRATRQSLHDPSIFIGAAATIPTSVITTIPALTVLPIW
jgi:hypothetical protein